MHVDYIPDITMFGKFCFNIHDALHVHVECLVNFDIHDMLYDCRSTYQFASCIHDREDGKETDRINDNLHTVMYKLILRYTTHISYAN